MKKNAFIIKKPIAHRGLYSLTYPENTLGAFEECVEKRVPIECDLRIIEDGTIVVIHDEILGRLTGKDGYTKNLTKDVLREHKIKGSRYSIPTLREVLNLVRGRVPILFEFKDFNLKDRRLEIQFLREIKNYVGEFAVCSFNPFVVKFFKEFAPKIYRGQLSSFFKGEKLGIIRKFLLKRMRFNKICKPHFILYNINNLPNQYVRKYKNLPLVAFVVDSKIDHKKLDKICDNFVFENYKNLE